MFLSIAFLAAGKGTRFSESHEEPKVAIPVANTTMSAMSIKNLFSTCLRPFIGKEDIFSPVVVITKELDEEYPVVREHIDRIDPDMPVKYVLQRGYVNGPAETASLLEFEVGKDQPLLISNVDQLIKGNVLDSIKEAVDAQLDGVIFCFKSEEDRYSYVSVDENGIAVEMIEKEVISEYASSGHIFFSKGENFFNYLNEARFSAELGQEIYISSVCNEAIKDGLKFKVVMLDSFVDMGTPEDLESLGEKWKLLR